MRKQKFECVIDVVSYPPLDESVVYQVLFNLALVVPEK